MTTTSRNPSPFSAASDPGPATQPADSGSALRAATKLNGSAAIVYAAGEVDASNVCSWGHLLAQAAKAAHPPGPFIVDVRKIDFLGYCAFAVLAREAQRCRRRGITLYLVSHQPVIARMVAICGLRWALPIHPSVKAALSQATAASGGASNPVGVSR